MSNQDVVIVSAKRTPIGAFQGVLTPLTAVQLGSAAAEAAIAAAGIDAAERPEEIGRAACRGRGEISVGGGLFKKKKKKKPRKESRGNSGDMIKKYEGMRKDLR